jgi:histidinol-phosphatase (PHP family)
MGISPTPTDQRPPTGWFSLHGGHSGEFCAHADGTLEELLAAAAASGCTVYGITEHAPRFGDWDLDDDERALKLRGVDTERRWERLAGHEFPRLRERFGDRPQLFLGIETDATDAELFAGRMRSLRDRYGAQYLVASVHHVAGLPIDGERADYERALEACGGAAALELEYCRVQRRAIEELAPEVLAHMDLIRFHADGTVPTAPVRAAYRDNLRRAARVGCLLDVNGSPFRDGGNEPFPAAWLLSEARRQGVRLTLGDDAHSPEQAGGGIAACLDAIGAAGYTEVWSFAAATSGAPRPVPVALSSLMEHA